MRQIVDWIRYFSILLIFVPSFSQGMTKDVIEVNNNDDIRLLFAQSAKRLVIKENIYLAKYKGAVIIGPDCILDFQGGTIMGGILKGERTKILSSYYYKIFEDIDIQGSWDVEYWVPQWFGAKGDGVNDDTEPIKITHRVAYNSAVEGVPEKEMGEMVIKLPLGRYYVQGNAIFGSVRDNDNDYSLRSVIYTLYGDFSSIIWTPTSVTSQLFVFDYTIRRERISNTKILLKNNIEGRSHTILINGKQRTLRTSGIVFRLKSDYYKGKYFISSQRNNYENVGVGPYSYEDSIVSGPDYVFYITGNCHCDMTRVSQCAFSLYNIVFYNENDQAVNWLFDHCSYNSYIPGSTCYYSRYFNDNLVIQNSEFDILSDFSTILKFKDEGTRSNNSSPLPNIIFQNNRVETQKTPGDGDIFIVDNDFGHVKIDNCNFLLQGTENNHIFRLSKDARMTIRDSDLKNTIIQIPIYDSNSYLEGNEIADAVVLDNVVHNRMTFKVWDYLNNKEYNVSEVLSQRNLKFRNVRVFNLKQHGQPLPSISFSIINDCLYGGKQTPLEEKSAIIECNGYTTGSVFRLPAYSMITRIELIGYRKPSENTEFKEVVIRNGSEEWKIPVNIILQDNNNHCIFNGFIGVLNDNLANEFSFSTTDNIQLQLRVSYCQYANLNAVMSEKKRKGVGYRPFFLQTKSNFR